MINNVLTISWQLRAKLKAADAVNETNEMSWYWRSSSCTHIMLLSLVSRHQCCSLATAYDWCILPTNESTTSLRLRNDLHYVEWDVKLYSIAYHTIPYHDQSVCRHLTQQRALWLLHAVCTRLGLNHHWQGIVIGLAALSASRVRGTCGLQCKCFLCKRQSVVSPLAVVYRENICIANFIATRTCTGRANKKYPPTICCR